MNRCTIDGQLTNGGRLSGVQKLTKLIALPRHDEVTHSSSPRNSWPYGGVSIQVFDSFNSKSFLSSLPFLTTFTPLPLYSIFNQAMPQLLNRTMTSTSTSADTATATSGQDPAFELDETTTQYLQSRADQLICVACGTQFAETERSKLTNCHICDDRKSLLFHVLLISQRPN